MQVENMFETKIGKAVYGAHAAYELTLREQRLSSGLFIRCMLGGLVHAGHNNFMPCR
jgi:hypothetical protein